LLTQETVNVHHLEKELNTIVLWPPHKNNMRLLTTRMMTILQEIHAKTGKHSYMDQCFITNLFRTLESSPTKKFLSFIDQLKSQWIMEEISDPIQIILKFDKMHHNMVANGSWLTTNKKDTEIMALTSALQEVQMKFGDLTKKVSFDQDKPKSPSKKDGKKSGGGKRPKLADPNGRLQRKGRQWNTRGASTSGVLTTPPRIAA
jgi:hypothetical protein